MVVEKVNEILEKSIIGKKALEIHEYVFTYRIWSAEPQYACHFSLCQKCKDMNADCKMNIRHNF